MVSFQRQFSTASPVLALPQPSYPGQITASAFPPPYTQIQSQANSMERPQAPRGRKRSRNEAGTNLEPDVPSEPIGESQDEWVYGEGMVLIKPNSGYIIDASTQSGTWIEEEIAAADDEVKRQIETAQVEVRRHKLQRMANNGASATTGLTGASPSVNTSSPDDPLIDNFTLHLGIGWRRISDDEHIQAAARGWAKFIENSYPLNDVQICLESKGLQSYLVKASEGFFLCSEDLRQARLVSRDAETVLKNLQQSPPSFDGNETMSSADTAAALTLSTTDMEMN